jgi:hypothetical protein
MPVLARAHSDRADGRDVLIQPGCTPACDNRCQRMTRGTVQRSHDSDDRGQQL